jgi:hypothetical protein
MDEYVYEIYAANVLLWLADACMFNLQSELDQCVTN